MQTIVHLPDTDPEPEPVERVELAALAQRGRRSPALARIVPRTAGGHARGDGTKGAFQSCV